MQEDIIRQVRDAEMRAEQKGQDAQARADAVLREARHQVVEVRQEILEAARKQAKDLFETGAKHFEPELAQIRRAYQAEIASDTANAQKNIETVVEFVVNKFYEQFE